MAIVVVPARPSLRLRRLSFKLLPAIACGLIGLHFSFCLVVVTHLNEWMEANWLLRPFVALSDRYSEFTFSNRNFGFFAPEVTPDWRLDIDTIDQHGSRKAFRFPAPSREMEIRLYSMIGHFTQDDDTMDLFARSWAVYAMNRVPDAVAVEIKISRNQLPTMSQFRAGASTSSSPIYRTKFELR